MTFSTRSKGDAGPFTVQVEVPYVAPNGTPGVAKVAKRLVKPAPQPGA